MSFFKKLFGSKPSAPETQTVDNSYTATDKEKEGYVNVGQNIFPVVRATDDPAIIMAQRNGNDLLTEELAEGITVAYVLDLGNNFEYISNRHLEKFMLTPDDLKAISRRNLVNRIGSKVNIGQLDFSDANPQSKPFFRAVADNNLEPSLMLVDDFWKQAEQIVSSPLVAVSIPAKNLLLFSNMKLMESFRTMRPVARQQYEQARQNNSHLTGNTYIRKHGKWVLFLDTEEQMAELWE